MINVSEAVKQALKAPIRRIQMEVQVQIDNEWIDLSSDVMAVDINSEVSSIKSDLPFGAVSSNTCTITLDNMSKKFMLNNKQSPYYGKLISLQEVHITYLVDVNDHVEKIPGGVYYTDYWKATTNGSTATVSCRDAIYKYSEKQIQDSKIFENISIHNAFVQVFQAAGLNQSEYEIHIDDAQSIKMFWINNTTFKEQLDQLTLATFTNVFCDANGKIQVHSLLDGNVSEDILSGDDLLINLTDSPTLLDKYSEVRIAFKTLALQEKIKVFDFPETKVFPGKNKIENIIFSAKPISRLVELNIIGHQAARIVDCRNNNATGTVTVSNNTADLQVVDLVGYGSVVRTQDAMVTATADTIICNNVLNLTTDYIFTYEKMQDACTDVLSAFSQGTANISIELRGYPILELLDIVRIKNKRTGTDQEYVVHRISYSYSGALSSTVTLVAIGGM